SLLTRNHVASRVHTRQDRRGNMFVKRAEHAVNSVFTVCLYLAPTLAQHAPTTRRIWTAALQSRLAAPRLVLPGIAQSPRTLAASVCAPYQSCRDTASVRADSVLSQLQMPSEEWRRPLNPSRRPAPWRGGRKRGQRNQSLEDPA